MSKLYGYVRSVVAKFPGGLTSYVARVLPDSSIKETKAYEAKTRMYNLALRLAKSRRDAAKNLEVKLESERARIQESIDSAVDETGKQYREDLTLMEKTYSKLESKLRDELGDALKQLELARGNLGYKEAAIKALTEERMDYLADAFETIPLLNDVAGLLLDKDFKRFRATPCFRKIVGATEKDISELTVPSMFAYLDSSSKRKVLEYSIKRLEQPFDIKMVDDVGKEHKFHLVPNPFLDRKGELVCTFIQFNEYGLGLKDKIMKALPSRRKVQERTQELTNAMLEGYSQWIRGIEASNPVS